MAIWPDAPLYPKNTFEYLPVVTEAVTPNLAKAVDKLEVTSPFTFDAKTIAVLSPNASNTVATESGTATPDLYVVFTKSVPSAVTAT